MKKKCNNCIVSIYAFHDGSSVIYRHNKYGYREIDGFPVNDFSV